MFNFVWKKIASERVIAVDFYNVNIIKACVYFPYLGMLTRSVNLTLKLQLLNMGL